MSSCQDLPGLDGIFFLSRAPLRRGSFLHALLRARSSGQEILQDVFPIGGGERLLANQALDWPMRTARLGLCTHDLVTRLTPRADEIGLMALSHESPFNFMFSGVPLTCAFQLHLPWDAGWHKRLWDTNEIPQAPSAVAQRRTLELLAAPSQRLLIDSVLRSRIAEAFVGGLRRRNPPHCAALSSRFLIPLLTMGRRPGGNPLAGCVVLGAVVANCSGDHLRERGGTGAVNSAVPPLLHNLSYRSARMSRVVWHVAQCVARKTPLQGYADAYDLCTTPASRTANR